MKTYAQEQLEYLKRKEEKMKKYRPIKTIEKLPGETIEDYRKRVSHYRKIIYEIYGKNKVAEFFTKNRTLFAVRKRRNEKQKD